MKALTCEGEERKAELKLLDSDRTDPKTRAAALYHLGVATDDADAFARSIALDPKGPCAPYAKFRRATLHANDKDPAVRRASVAELNEITFGPDRNLAREALYFAAMRSYSDGRHGEASSLFRKYMRMWPGDEREAKAREMAAWSDYLGGKYSDAAALCAGQATDAAAYLRGACAYAMGDHAAAKAAMKKYLEDHPAGKYRKSVELPLARIAFAEAEKSGDAPRIYETAKRCFELTGKPHDRMRLAWALEKSGRADDAAAEYQAVARDFPGTAEASEALFRKAMIDIRAERWSAADVALKESSDSARDASRRGETLYWRGVAETRLGHAEEGAALLREALKENISVDRSREARLIVADADFAAGRLADAKAAYAKLVAEGATARMGAAKLRDVGRFLLECPDGENAEEGAKTCARALVDTGKSPAWRQIAFTLLGRAEEASGERVAAIGSYRQALAESIRTEESKTATLRLGALLSEAGEYAEADAVLREAVALNSGEDDAARRAEAYLKLALNCEANSDPRGACAYATILTSLFDDDRTVAEAKRILAAHPEEVE
jgi:tetratricopeptide (TPR) repeat protein